MHPIFEHRRRFALYLASWIPIAALLTALLAFSSGLRWLEAAVLVAPMSAVYALACLAAWYLCRTFPLAEKGIIRLLGIHTAAAVLSSSLWLLFGKGWVAAVSTVPELSRLDAGYAGQAPLLFVVGVLLFLLAATVHYAIASFESARDAERRALELKVLAREAELRALKAQIDPHFLFNSLNSISALTSIDPAGARRMSIMLADFLRKSLSLGAQDLISLDEEIALVASFLAVEQIRLGPRLKTENRISETTKACLVPPLMLQPLVENAILHGIEHLLEGGSILIESARRGDRVHIAVENPCDPDSNTSRAKGIGLANVRNRLVTLYGTEARLDFDKRDGKFRVQIVLPAREKSVRPDRQG